MSGPPFTILYTREAEKVLVDLRDGGAQYAVKRKKVRKAIRLLEQIGPRPPGLHAHAYQSVPGPGGVALWESYVENRTPSAWRIWWTYGPGTDQITIVTVGPHPEMACRPDGSASPPSIDVRPVPNGYYEHQ